MSDDAPVPTTDEALASKTLEEDLSALLELGLQLSDVERLWQQNKEVDMADVCAAATNLLGLPGHPVKRQVTVGLEIAKSSASSAEILPDLVELLRGEMDEPPEEFRDPVMLTLMNDPVVLSSGHVFDRSTVYDGGAFRFQCCPMTRERLEQKAFPLVYLKSQLVDFKLRRLDGIISVVGRVEAVRVVVPTAVKIL